MFRRYVSGFGLIVHKVVENRLSLFEKHLVLVPEWKLLLIAWKMEFPGAFADGLQILSVVIEERLVGFSGQGFPFEQRK